MCRFRGAPEALQAVVQNDVQLYLAGWGVGRSLVQSGQVMALAVAAEQRLPNVPDLPIALMVSRVRYPHFFTQLLRGRKPRRTLLQVVFGVARSSGSTELALPIVFCWFALASTRQGPVVRARSAPSRPGSRPAGHSPESTNVA